MLHISKIPFTIFRQNRSTYIYRRSKNAAIRTATLEGTELSNRIIYYTRSGSCAQLARAYAKKSPSYLVQVMDSPEKKYWGALGYLKAALHTMMKKELPYRLVGEPGSRIDEIILITPVWASQLPPTLRTFLSKESLGRDIKITVVTVSDHGNGRDTFRQAVDILHQAGAREIHHRNLRRSEINSAE